MQVIIQHHKNGVARSTTTEVEDVSDSSGSAETTATSSDSENFATCHE